MPAGEAGVETEGAVDELVRELCDRTRVLGSLRQLMRAGLAHDSNGFVLASRSAVVFEQIAG